MSLSETPGSPFPPPPTNEDQLQQFNAKLKELMMTPADLAHFLDKNSDYRDFSATIRSIQRMVAGETRVSGEMMVIVNMLIRQHRRLKAKYGPLKWQQNEHGTYWAQVEDWFVYLSPQTRGRWILSCSHGQSAKDYSPPFGRWLSSLLEAQTKALACVEEGMNDVACFDAEADA